MKTQSNLPSEQIVQKFKALSETTENRMLWLTILKTVGRYPFIVTEKVRSVSFSHCHYFAANFNGSLEKIQKSYCSNS